MAKFGWAIDVAGIKGPRGLERATEHLRGVCLGIEADVSHVPIVNDVVVHVLNMVGREGKHIVERYKIHANVKTPMCSESLDFLHHHYQWTESTYNDFQSYIQTIVSYPSALTHPAIDSLVEHAA
jgi:hypothetical protein